MKKIILLLLFLTAATIQAQIPQNQIRNTGWITDAINSKLGNSSFDSLFALKTTTDLPEGTNLYFTNTRAQSAFSSTVTGLAYGSGVLSLTAGYVIPTTIEEGNWNTAYGWGNHASAGYMLRGDSTSLYYTQNDLNGLLGAKFNIADSNTTKNVATFDFARNASNLDLGTIPSGRLSGSYVGITGLGTVTLSGIATFTRYAISDSLYGSTASAGNLYLSSTTHATKGKIYFGANSAYDQVNDRLGIGRTNPSAKLDLVASSNSDGVYIRNNTGITSVGITNLDTAGIGTSAIYFNSINNTAHTSDINFYTRGSGFNAMIIKNAGNVGIGTTSPNYLLGVAGTMGLGKSGSTSGSLTWVASDNDQINAAIGTDDKLSFTGGTGGYSFDGSATFGGLIKATLSTYADDAAAGTGGLTTGQFYQTATGELRIKL